MLESKRTHTHLPTIVMQQTNSLQLPPILNAIQFTQFIFAYHRAENAICMQHLMKCANNNSSKQQKRTRCANRHTNVQTDINANTAAKLRTNERLKQQTRAHRQTTNNAHTRWRSTVNVRLSVQMDIGRMPNYLFIRKHVYAPNTLPLLFVYLLSISHYRLL